MSNTIFIQIASYRDPELVPTIECLIANASNPENLRFGICRQYSPDDGFDDLSVYKRDERFRILDIEYQESRGACNARNRIQCELYRGEAWTLQVDSHMRAARNWDGTCISLLNHLVEQGHVKPLLTAYLPPYDPKNDPAGRGTQPFVMEFDKFAPNGVVLFKSAYCSLDAKVAPARFYSAHFCFAPGSFAVEVRHNPDMYFHGEEISIAARAFTHGYDMFHPVGEVFMWHEYTRSHRRKQWDDDSSWHVKDAASHVLTRRLFGMHLKDLPLDSLDSHLPLDSLDSLDSPQKDEYGFGTARTLEEYEAFSGLNFKSRTFVGGFGHVNNLIHVNNPSLDIDLKRHEIEIVVPKSSLPETDYEFWAVAIHSQDDATMYREDACMDEISRVLGRDDTNGTIKRVFTHHGKPAYAVLWPFSKSKQWCQRIVQVL